MLAAEGDNNPHQDKAGIAPNLISRQGSIAFSWGEALQILFSVQSCRPHIPVCKGPLSEDHSHHTVILIQICRKQVPQQPSRFAVDYDVSRQIISLAFYHCWALTGPRLPRCRMGNGGPCLRTQLGRWNHRLVSQLASPSTHEQMLSLPARYCC